MTISQQNIRPIIRGFIRGLLDPLIGVSLQLTEKQCFIRLIKGDGYKALIKSNTEAFFYWWKATQLNV